MRTALGLSLALMLVAASAQAHMVGCDNKPVPASIKSSCCGQADAHMLDPGQIHQADDGSWHIAIGAREIVLPDKKAEPSPDGCYWIFYPATWEADGSAGEPSVVYCFLVPMGI